MAFQLSDNVKAALERALDEAYELGRQEGFKQAEQEIADALTRTAASSSILSQDIDVLNLSERPRNCLKRAQRVGVPPRFKDVQTVGDLILVTEDDLLSITNFGQKSVDEVHAKLAEHGLKLTGG